MAALNELFAYQVPLDHTRLNGGGPVRLTPQQIVDAWRGYGATQYLIASHLVHLDGDHVVRNASFDDGYLGGRQQGPARTGGGLPPGPPPPALAARPQGPSQE